MLAGLCVSLWDVHFAALQEEQGIWHNPRECPSALVTARKHQMLSFIYRWVINSLGNAASVRSHSCSFMNVTSLKVYLLMS